mmetsp:Transcript_20435/g.28305  ORF Transcript_20435/g.28305 Transcript_20435/m.28305 type:complete len:222 (-) Transcript_20435:676-1341(-)
MYSSRTPLISSLSVTSTGLRFSLSPRLGSAPSSSIILTAAKLPCQVAAKSGVQEETPAPASKVPTRWSIWSQSPPLAMHNSTHSGFPPRQAAQRGVRPCSSALWISAPADRSNSAVSANPLQQAAISAVLPWEFCLSTSASASMRASTELLAPCHAAAIRGVSPSTLVSFTSAILPVDINRFTTSPCPFIHAAYRGVSPFSSPTVISAPASINFAVVSVWP